ncbi:helicase-related protein [Candidatus Palauibacter sp.]|uniref:helicase-related protein n=1 Tax=Candidatus Palauibacter sp. TaxID=3101350 RepID=UPI003B51E723
MKLERIVPGSRLSGIAGDGAVEVVATRSYGLDAVEVTWRGPGGLGDPILYREDEPRIREVSPGRRWAFDGDGDAFRLASEALRIRLAHLFDPYAAVNASHIEPLPHQLTAVYDAMLGRQPLRFLLADDPGAGKTVMAGLLIKELLIRGSLERCLIIAPGNLVEQWQDELHEKFDLGFEILTRMQIEASRTGSPFAEHPRLIARLDMLARNDELKAKLEAAPEWDLIVVDEAHRMSASFYGREVKYTKRFQLGALAGRLTRHFLLMTATPHNGKEEDFQLFMGLLDGDRFEGRFREGVHKVDPSDMMRRLVKEELYRFDGTPLFPERRAYTVSYGLSPGEAALYEAVTRYVREEMNRADRLAEDGTRRRNNIGFALQILQRRLASSPAAIHESLKRRMARLGDRLEEEKLVRAGRMPAARRAADPVPALDEEDFEEAPGDEAEAHEDQLVDSATAAQTIAELEAEIAELRRLERMAGALRRSGEDTKWRELDRILDDPLVHDPARDVQRKIVIFTEARDTLEYLAGRIRARTGESESVAVIHGGVPRDRRRAVIAAFNDDPAIRFLLANDAAGEGVNLQRGAHLMVNYDLPWNPNRIEQRFGRIHRIGQTEVCHLWNLVSNETREGAVYERLLEKLETARVTLGGKVYDVLGELFEARPLKDLFMEAIRYGERDDVRERLFRAVDGAVDTEHINRLVERGKLTREGLDPATIGRVREEMDRAAARRLQPHHIRSFFEAAFQDAGGVIRARERGRFELTRVPAILRDRDRLIGRGYPVLSRYRRICFAKEGIGGRPQAALVAPGHPLLDALVDLTLERYGDLLLRGTLLVDESDHHDGPRVLVTLRHRVRDGQATRHDTPRTVSERLQFVWLDADGGAADGGAAPYLDCRGSTEAERGELAPILDAPWLGEPLEERARAHAITDLVPRHLREIREVRLAQLDRIEAAVKERMRREIMHLQHRALELETLERAGRKPRLNSQNVRRQAEALRDRLELRLTDIARQRDIAPLPPEVRGAALVVPARMLRPEVAGDAADAAARAEVEAMAMKAVMARERSFGNEPADISRENRGYDIESRDPDTGRLRFIEVKGRRADARISITRNEMVTALNAAESYILALVLVDGGDVAAPIYLRDPGRIFGAEPNFHEVSRQISTKAIETAARRGSN